MFFISLFILFFAIVFAFDRFIFRDFSEQFDTIGQLFRVHRTSNELRDMRISSLEKRLNEFEEKFGKITDSHNSRIEKIEGFSILEPKKNWEKFTQIKKNAMKKKHKSS